MMHISNYKPPPEKRDKEYYEMVYRRDYINVTPGKPSISFEEFWESHKKLDASEIKEKAEKTLKREADVSNVLGRIETHKGRIPSHCIMKKKKSDLSKPCIAVGHIRKYKAQADDRHDWHHFTEYKPFKKQVRIYNRAEEASDKDWVIQGEGLPLHMLWCILQSRISIFWFMHTMPPGSTLTKARLASFPLPQPTTEGI